jgi:hypothetical protein
MSDLRPALRNPVVDRFDQNPFQGDRLSSIRWQRRPAQLVHRALRRSLTSGRSQHPR